MIRIAAFGDNVVDCYLSRNEMYPGGNCLNLSVFIRRFGGFSAYVGAIGQDAAGRLIQGALVAEGVDTSHLRVLDGPTAYCIIGHNEDGDRHFVDFDLGVSMFVPSAGDFDFLNQFDAVHVGQSSGLDDHLPQLPQSVRLSYDFSSRRDREHRHRIGPRCFLASISGGDLTDDEARALIGEMLSAKSEWVLVTRGKQGALLANKNETFSVAAAPADVVDTLGAGDTFIARVLFGLLQQEAVTDTLRYAAVAAAETCRYFGAVGYPAKIEIARAF